jgi:predicted transcriptional regulator
MIGEAVRKSRRRAGLSQRELAERTGIPQSTIARLESGMVDPRTGTVVKLLAACGEELAVLPRIGVGIDRTLIRPLLDLTPQQRLEAGAAAGRGLRRLLDSRDAG